MSKLYTKEILADIKEKAKIFNSDELKIYMENKYGRRLTKNGYIDFKQTYHIQCIDKSNKYTKEIINYAKEQSRFLTEKELKLDLREKFNLEFNYMQKYRYFLSKYKICCIDYKPKRKYTKEITDYIKKRAKDTTRDELYKDIKIKFNFETTKVNFVNRLYDMGIQCKDARIKPKGTEQKWGGRTFIKLDNDYWKLKSRAMYEKYNNEKLTTDEYIIFLNGNKSDFSKENLYKISKQEFYIVHNRKLFSTNENLTKLAILSAKVMKKTKEITQ